MRIAYIPAPDLWASSAVKVGQDLDATWTTSETWINILLQHALHHVAQHDTTIILQHHNTHESLCDKAIKQFIYFEKRLPPSWTIEINPQLQPKTIPSLKLYLRTSQGEQLFYLRAIIYTGNQHFTARLIIGSSIWNYDGAKNDGKPYFYTETSNSEWRAEHLLRYEERDMYQLIYGS
jgi:hypothetical protein